MKITEPGIYSMPAAAYHADPCPIPSLSAGACRTIVSQSELHAWVQHPRLNPNFEAEESGEFDIGSAAHALVCEGDDRMVSVPYDDWRKKDAQNARDEARACGRHPVLTKTYDSIFLMRETLLRAVAECEDLSGIKLSEGRAEQTIITCEDGLWARCRPDLGFDDWKVVIDYKTTKDANPRTFGKHIIRMGYHVAASFYSRRIEQVMARRPRYIFMAQDVKKPHAVSFHDLAPSVMEIADRLVDEGEARWRAALEFNRWPSYRNRIHSVEATSWQLAEAEEREMDAGMQQDGDAYGRMMAVK